MGDSVVDVVWLDLHAGLEETSALFAALADDEKARVAELGTTDLKRRATVRFARRREVLARMLEVAPHAVRLTRDVHGRPLALGPRGAVAVSSSSSGDVGLLAIAASHVIGADVEATSEMVDTIGFLDRVATARERLIIVDLAPDERRHALARLWTRKEAYLKATGEGIGEGVAHVDVPLDEGLWQAAFQPAPKADSWLLYDLAAPRDGFAAALVVATAGSRVPEIVVSRP